MSMRIICIALAVLSGVMPLMPPSLAVQTPRAPSAAVADAKFARATRYLKFLIDVNTLYWVDSYAPPGPAGSRELQKIRVRLPELELAAVKANLKGDYENGDKATLQALDLLGSTCSPFYVEGVLKLWLSDNYKRKHIGATSIWRKAFKDYPTTLAASLRALQPEDYKCSITKSDTDDLYRAILPKLHSSEDGRLAIVVLASFQLESKFAASAVKSYETWANEFPREIQARLGQVSALIANGQNDYAMSLAKKTTQNSTYESNGYLCQEFADRFAHAKDYKNACWFYRLATLLRENEPRVGDQSSLRIYERWRPYALKGAIKDDVQFTGAKIAELKILDKKWAEGAVEAGTEDRYVGPESTNPEVQANRYNLLSALRTKQKRPLDAAQFNKLAIKSLLEAYATNHSETAIWGLINTYRQLGDTLFEAGQVNEAIESWQQSLSWIHKHPFSKDHYIRNPYDLELKIAEVQNRSCDSIYQEVFARVNSDIRVSEGEQSIRQQRAKSEFVDNLERQATYFTDHNRTDLAVKTYQRGIAILDTAFDHFDSSLSKSQSKFLKMLKGTKQDNLSSLAVPACPKCASPSEVKPDYPGGCVIDREYFWRCNKCDLTF